jgi:hypothetical protein
MKATILSQAPTGTPDQTTGHYESKQDPDTGDIIRVWVPATDDPATGPVEPSEIDCMVRGIITDGINVAGTTERFTPQGVYESVDFVKMNFAPHVVLTKRDRITNVRNQKGEIVWKEEESDNNATVFDVLGVTPVLDPFGNHVENLAFLKRAGVQQYGT